MTDIDLTTSRAMSGFYSTLVGMMGDGIDAEDAAAQLLERDEYKTTIVRLLAMQGRNIQRQKTRIAERQAAVAVENTNYQSAKSILLGHSFPLPSGEFVSWTEATVDQHRQRAQWFRDRAKTYSENAQLHEDVVALLEETGTRCLGEIVSIDAHPAIAAKVKGKLNA